MTEPQGNAAQTGQDGQQTGDSSQQQSSGEADTSQNQNASTEKTYSKAEFDQVVGQRQAAKDELRRLNTQFAELQEHMKTVPSAEQLEAFSAWQTEQDAKERDAAMKKGEVEVLEKKVAEPLRKQIEAKDGRLKVLEAQLTGLLRDNALKLAAASADVYSPDQVVMLLRHRVRMVAQADGTFTPEFLDADGGPQFDGNSQRVTDAQTFVKLYLSLPENANLIKTAVAPGSGAKPPGGGNIPPKGAPKNLDEFNALPPEDREKWAKELGSAWIKAQLGMDTSKRQGSFLTEG